MSYTYKKIGVVFNERMVFTADNYPSYLTPYDCKEDLYALVRVTSGEYQLQGAVVPYRAYFPNAAIPREHGNVIILLTKGDVMKLLMTGYALVDKGVEL